jgi:hypothetical protein
MKGLLPLAMRVERFAKVAERFGTKLSAAVGRLVGCPF